MTNFYDELRRLASQKLAQEKPGQTQAILRGQLKHEFSRCLTEKMLTYALGRELEDYDEPTFEQIALALSKNGDRFSTLIVEIVRSDPFLKRRGQRKAAP